MEYGQKLQNEVYSLTKQLAELTNEENKYEEKMTEFKQHKKFLGLLAISAGKKKLRPQLKKAPKEDK